MHIFVRFPARLSLKKELVFNGRVSLPMYAVNLEMDNSPNWVLANIVSGQIASDALWKSGEVFSLRIWPYFLFLRAVVNIPIQTVTISSCLLFRKMTISQPELGPPMSSHDVVDSHPLRLLPMIYRSRYTNFISSSSLAVTMYDASLIKNKEYHVFAGAG